MKQLFVCFLNLVAAVATSAAIPLFETVTVHSVTPANRPNHRIPAIITAPNGDVLIFTEKRNDGIGDIGNHDLVLVRSRDLGRTWGREELIFDDGDNTSTDTTLCVDRERGRIFAFFLKNKKQFAYFTSDDSGRSWRGPRVIHDSVTRPEWDKVGLKGGDVESGLDPESSKSSHTAGWGRNWVQRYGVGPGSGGIQLTKGPHKGRLLIPARHKEELPDGTVAGFSHVFYSDDHGETWKLGPNVARHGNECRLVELSDGTVMMSMRNGNDDDQPDNSRRLVALSRDGGDSWPVVYRDDALVSTTVHAGLHRVVAPGFTPEGLLLFSNPASPIRQKEHPYGRYNLTVRWSRDDGKTWSAGRPIYAHPSSYSDMALLPDGTIGLVYERGAKDVVHYWDEIQFARFNLDWLLAPAHTAMPALGVQARQGAKTADGEHSETGTFAALPIASEILVGGSRFQPARLPAGLKLDDRLGLVTGAAVKGNVVHRTGSRILETRGLKTPGGDYLVMFAEGEHYANNKGTRKNNAMMASRSSDGGRTWSKPSEAFNIDYSQHGFVPFVPRGSKRIYAFGTQPDPDHGYDWRDGKQENAPIGFRWSDDDGHTWSDATLIRPSNDPEFKGMSVMRMAETDAGTWLIGSHLADWAVKPFTTQQYLLRSTDQGQSWELLPGKRPAGWAVAKYRRMDEARPINLGGGKVLLMSRTPAGSLYVSRSEDDGKSWSEFQPSPLVHPGAPPMLFHLRDGRTLIAFHHNRVPLGQDDMLPEGSIDPQAENMKVRSELWFSTSTDLGKTWSEPRFVLANAAEPTLRAKAWNFQCSYLDMFMDGEVLHLLLPHRWEQVLHLTINESELTKLPTKSQLAQLSSALKP